MTSIVPHLIFIGVVVVALGFAAVVIGLEAQHFHRTIQPRPLVSEYYRAVSLLQKSRFEVGKHLHREIDSFLQGAIEKDPVGRE